MLKLIIISLRWQWYLTGRSTSVHWSKNCCGSTSGWKPIHSPHISGWCAFDHQVIGRAVPLMWYITAAVVAPAVMLRVLGPLAQCDILSALNIFTAGRYALAEYAMAMCPSVCSSQVVAQPITVICKATRVYMPILGGVVWTFYRVLCKNGWTDRRQSPKLTPIHAKCCVVVAVCFAVFFGHCAGKVLLERLLLNLVILVISAWYLWIRCMWISWPVLHSINNELTLKRCILIVVVYEFWTRSNICLASCSYAKKKIVYVYLLEVTYLKLLPILKTRSSAIAEGPRDASCQLKSCQLPRNSAETTYTTSPDQINGMKL